VYLEVVTQFNTLLAKYIESKHNLVVLNKYNQYRKGRIISLLILLELLFKDIRFVIRLLDNNRGSMLRTHT
jgi:hypothetical protein